MSNRTPNLSQAELETRRAQETARDKREKAARKRARTKYAAGRKTRAIERGYAQEGDRDLQRQPTSRRGPHRGPKRTRAIRVQAGGKTLTQGQSTMFQRLCSEGSMYIGGKRDRDNAMALARQDIIVRGGGQEIMKPSSLNVGDVIELDSMWKSRCRNAVIAAELVEIEREARKKAAPSKTGAKKKASKKKAAKKTTKKAAKRRSKKTAKRSTKKTVKKTAKRTTRKKPKCPPAKQVSSAYGRMRHGKTAASRKRAGQIVSRAKRCKNPGDLPALTVVNPTQVESDFFNPRIPEDQIGWGE